MCFFFSFKLNYLCSVRGKQGVTPITQTSAFTLVFLFRTCPSLCPSVLWHRQKNINVASSNSVVMFVKSACLPCASRLLLCLAKCAAAQCWSSDLCPRRSSYCRGSAVEYIVTSFNGQKAVSRIPVHWNLYGSLTNGMWQGWQASECGQLSREPNVTPYPVRSLFCLL